jgi:hypothetical protein
LKIETSFPKLLYGNNVAMVKSEDVEPGIDKLSEIVSSCVGKELDVHAAEIQGRVDFVFSFDTLWDDRGHVGDYLDAFKTLELPRHYTQNVARDATLYWRNRSRVIRMYDKEKESGEISARDNLRFEVQMNHAKAELGRLVPGIASLKLQDVARWDVAKTVLNNYLNAMGADLVVADERKLARKLVAELGPARARRLMGYIVFLRLYGHDGMERLGFERTMAWRDRHELESAGVSAAVGAEQDGLLPALRLPDEYSGEPLRLGI